MSKENGDLYFPHDFNSANDEKTIAFLSSYGAEGYGIFWLIVEQMHKNEGIYENKEYNYRATAHRSLTTVERIKTILSDLVNCELFYEDDAGYYSERVIKNLEKSKKISVQNAENARKRKVKTSDRSATASDRSATAHIQDKTKEDKIKEEKDKKEKTEILQFPDWFDASTKLSFLAYMKMRTQMKKKPTETALQLLYNKLEKLSGKDNNKALQVLENSIMNNWIGLFEVKEEKKPEPEKKEFSSFNSVFDELYKQFRGKANVSDCEQFLRNEDQNGRCDIPLDAIYRWGVKLCMSKYKIEEKPKQKRTLDDYNPDGVKRIDEILNSIGVGK